MYATAGRTATADLSGVWALPHRPESARTARRIARCALDAWGIDDDITERVLLVVSELVTNAVEHARPPVALHLDLPADGSLHIEVDDGGRAAEEGAWTASRGTGEHGRGTGIIGFLAHAHGARTHQSGATHWAHLPVGPCTAVPPGGAGPPGGTGSRRGDQEFHTWNSESWPAGQPVLAVNVARK
ncbi:ATP-binding protein [Streptomyces sp. NPDC051976]|uniref:ATP-binding protein n=1 Tax=Streptomyces sp. NPDC051976 TaxID=3154947 RepID=UPI00342E2F9C